MEAGIAQPDKPPELPWHRIQGTGDATTMWYAVMRKEVRPGIFIGALCFRHSDHHASLLHGGWHEVPPREIQAMYSSSTSGIRMRTQPCDALVPMEFTASVPWMPAPS